MAEFSTVHDPFLNKDVQISNRLTDRLRGKYASGPHLPNGNPEFGWRQFQAPPIQHEAAAEIDRLTRENDALRKALDGLLQSAGWHNYTNEELRHEEELGNEKAPILLRARAALALKEPGQ